MTDKATDNDYYVIDLLYLAKCVWHRAWIVVLATIAAAAIGFAYSAFIIQPKYSSSILLYVNNSSISVGNTSFSISSSEITAAQSLVKTYTIILNNRTTLEEVIERSQVPYTYEELGQMIEAGPVNNTEIMSVKVTSTDPYEAAKIVNCIAEVLPKRISVIINGTSMEVVDAGVPDLQKVSPSITKYTAMGMFIGAAVSIFIIVLLAIMDNTIHDEDYVLQTYGFPVLAKVPDLVDSGSGKSKYGYYASYGK